MEKKAVRFGSMTGHTSHTAKKTQGISSAGDAVFCAEQRMASQIPRFQSLRLQRLEFSESRSGETRDIEDLKRLLM